MKRSKDIFLEIVERLFAEDPFERMMREEDYLQQKEQKFETETHDIVKGDYKNHFEYIFDEKGNLVGHNHVQEYIPSKEEELKNQQLTLRQQLEQAVQEEDYKKAAELKNLLLELKPTE